MPKFRALIRSVAVSFLCASLLQAQEGHPPPTPPPFGAKTITCSGRPIPQFVDDTAKAGITFTHHSDPSKEYIVESMSAGVLLIDYNRDGWPDIYFTNAPTVADAIKDPKTLGVDKTLGALYRNNHDGTFTDVTKEAGLTKPCFAMG
ncbi:MAG TPA: VCBS repeat-containing protein, partial [Terracidiphilus sp.]|nr:VCBS repeat-containing protein [Terracidiphilus sp.]